ncbi:MAG: hypothetical protein QM778_18850 [Myxococcales bacterium]
MKSLCGVLTLALLFLASGARAQMRNEYGAEGRTVVQTGLNASVNGSGFTQSHQAWHAGGRFTMVHFIRNNFAMGGTLTFDMARLRDTGFFDEPVATYGGGDLDLVGHIPLNRHLSLRIWTWFGVRDGRRRILVADPYEGARQYPPHLITQKLMQATLGISTELLLHLSSSAAIGFGPSFTAYAPLSEVETWEWRLNFGPNLTYSFGAPPRDGRDEKPVLPAFARRGKNVLGLNVAMGSNMVGSVGYMRFLTDHFAFGAHVFGGAREVGSLAPYWLGAGLQGLIELPLKDRWSLLLQPEIDYRFDRMVRFAYSTPDIVANSNLFGGVDTFVVTHELQFSAALVPVFHLFDALVMGAGPFVTEHVRVASSGANLDTAYLSLGLTSVMAASF